MSGSSRYFINNLKDFTPGESFEVPRDAIKSQCLDYLQEILDKHTNNPEECDSTLYVGLAGISYSLFHIAQNPIFKNNRQDYLKRSLEYMQTALSNPESRKPKRGPAFVLGSAGVYAVGAAVHKALRNESESDSCAEQFASLADEHQQIHHLGSGPDELLAGRAGYLAGMLFLKRVLGEKVLLTGTHKAFCDAIINSGTNYSRKHKSSSPLMFAYHKKEYLGAAHGLSGILQILLCFPDYLEKNPEAEKKVKGSVDYLLSTQTKSGHFPSGTTEVEKPKKEANQLVHWCHGAPGVVYLMAKAYQRWKEEKYLQSCLLCGELTWAKGLLCKGPGICHGVAGSGYVFLLLHRLTGDPVHLHRAVEFAGFMKSDEFTQHARVPDRPLSLYEGLAGTVCFLADLLSPEQAQFPFMNVFE